MLKNAYRAVNDREDCVSNYRNFIAICVFLADLETSFTVDYDSPDVRAILPRLALNDEQPIRCIIAVDTLPPFFIVLVEVN